MVLTGGEFGAGRSKRKMSCFEERELDELEER
jgi:hypothetical protein